MEVLWGGTFLMAIVLWLALSETDAWACDSDVVSWMFMASFAGESLEIGPRFAHYDWHIRTTYPLRSPRSDSTSRLSTSPTPRGRQLSRCVRVRARQIGTMTSSASHVRSSVIVDFLKCVRYTVRTYAYLQCTVSSFSRPDPDSVRRTRI
ncbi:hypothetical protein BD309DRAFT_960568 [Dichomitus squalens]|uniref:Uncharacterized protein n=1 Tax=Dichomitus squalens TaxID=114155 RepID=A0A4Q9NQM0_9APHY|nr:hypothetical protein BD309DRAFT_960568 [Dichomitus squalens]TBU60169.1 hypothetical protein BD310DRAFT_350327 [Dichomitus squalens]